MHWAKGVLEYYSSETLCTCGTIAPILQIRKQTQRDSSILLRNLELFCPIPISKMLNVLNVIKMFEMRRGQA